MEYAKTDSGRSKELFMQLIKERPHYLPAYYMAADLLTGMEETGHALEIIKAGMEVAAAQKDLKTLMELKNLQSRITE
jgi:hypothetical protein